MNLPLSACKLSSTGAGGGVVFPFGCNFRSRRSMKVINFGSPNIDPVRRGRKFVRPGETVPAAASIPWRSELFGEAGKRGTD